MQNLYVYYIVSNAKLYLIKMYALLNVFGAMISSYSILCHVAVTEYYIFWVLLCVGCTLFIYGGFGYETDDSGLP